MESVDTSVVVESVVQEADRLLAALSSFCTKSNTDVTILCQEETFKCHSVLLKARSLVFFKMLDGGDKITIDNIRPVVMDKVINYIYTGQVINTRDLMLELIIAGNRFELPGLLDKCLEIFQSQINFDNAPDILIVANKHGLEDFKKVAIDKITVNRTMLMADPEFRTKMRDNPQVLLLLYDDLCQVMHPSNLLTGSTIWPCVCGASVVGQFCSWCGNSA